MVLKPFLIIIGKLEGLLEMNLVAGCALRVAGCGFFDFGFGIADFGLQKTVGPNSGCVLRGARCELQTVGYLDLPWPL